MTIDLARPAYFLNALGHQVLPMQIATRRLARLLPGGLAEVSPDLLERVHWYCKLQQGCALPGTRLGALFWRDGKEFYYFDLMRLAKGFGPEMRLDRLFGDIAQVPDRPSLLKSRPIHGENTNSVLLPLNRLRHFNFPEDPVPFADKRPVALWRGRLGSPDRQPACHALVAAQRDQSAT